jgi:hypothetical protein
MQTSVTLQSRALYKSVVKSFEVPRYGGGGQVRASRSVNYSRATTSRHGSGSVLCNGEATFWPLRGAQEHSRHQADDDFVIATIQANEPELERRAGGLPARARARGDQRWGRPVRRLARTSCAASRSTLGNRSSTASEISSSSSISTSRSAWTCTSSSRWIPRRPPTPTSTRCRTRVPSPASAGMKPSSR